MSRTDFEERARRFWKTAFGHLDEQTIGKMVDLDVAAAYSEKLLDQGDNHPASARDLVRDALDAALNAIPEGTNYSLAVAVSKEGRAHSAQAAGGDAADVMSLSVRAEVAA